MRGTGTTTQQMRDAPKGAYFVWCNCALDYPRELASKHGRDDLNIVTPFWLEEGRWRGLEMTGLVIDHAALLTGAQLRGLQDLQPMIRRRA